MNKIKCFMLVVLALGSATAFAAKENTFRFQNSVRVGYDDNIYLSDDASKEGTAFITDIINITGKMVFSDRSDLILYWQPEFRYRLDADPNFITYQDLYARLNHAVSQRTFFQISDRFRYQEKDGQSDLGRTENQNFLENDLLGSLDFTLNSLSQIKVGGGYEFRTWDDDDYGEVYGNNFDQFKVNGMYVRELRPNTTHGRVGINYVNHEYNGSRGGYDSTSLFGGVDYNFNPNLLGTLDLGYSFSTVDGASESQDSSSPYLQAGLDYNPTDRTSINGLIGYSLSMSENSYYNAQDGFNMGLGLRHDLTGKISLSSTLSGRYSMFDASYAADTPGLPPGFTIPDAEEIYLTFSLRGSYQINRNNFLDLGYEYSYRDTDQVAGREYNRNRVDFGWRLRL